MDAYQSAVPRGAYLRCSWGSVSMPWKRNRVLRVATKRGTHYLLWQPWLPLYQATLVRGAFGASNTNASRYAISGLLFLSSFSDLVPYSNTPLCIYEPSRLDQAQGALQRSQRIPERPPAAWGYRRATSPPQNGRTAVGRWSFRSLVYSTAAPRIAATTRPARSLVPLSRQRQSTTLLLRIRLSLLVACAARAGSIGFTQGPHSRI